jgi:uncharacterized damage-inducible protein DinB
MIDDRPGPPDAGEEKETLEGFLDFHRATLLKKVDGLDDEQLRRSMTPSGLSLLGLVKHLAYVERWWFQAVFAGRDVDFPWTDQDPDADFRVEPDESTETVLVLYRDETAKSREICATGDLNSLAKAHRTQHSLRWIMNHMIEETARHNGHADLMREALDGVTGE